jgi:Tfp pilus assembly protein PilF
VLQDREKALRPDYISILSIVNNLGAFYKNQNKLAKAEKMYIQALQDYKEALGLELILSYLLVLNTIVNFNNLFLQTNQQNIAKEIYTRILSRYIIIQGLSST